MYPFSSNGIHRINRNFTVTTVSGLITGSITGFTELAVVSIFGITGATNTVSVLGVKGSSMALNISRQQEEFLSELKYTVSDPLYFYSTDRFYQS